MSAATNIPISATTTDYVGAVNAAIAATGNFDRVINSQLVTSFRALDRQTRTYEQGLGRVARQIAAQAAEAARAAAAAQASAQAAIAAAAQRVQAIGSNFQSVGQSLTTYVTAPLALVSGLAFNAYAQIDGMVKGLTAATGSASEANKQFKEFYEISKNPGLGLEQTVAAGLQLEVLGYKAQTAQKYVAEVGNAIALGGKGKVEFGSVMTQFTQMAGKAKVLSEDLKPIVTASPVIARAIKDIFGSVDSETISGKLQAAGKGPKDFIELLVTELSKVERVAAGPKTALENFGDAAAIASYNVAGVADKLFDITGTLLGFSDLIGKAAEGFAQMDPTGQTAILSLAGIAAATGPVTLAIGTVIKLLPVLKAGFTALTGPVGLAAAAAVTAAVLIYTHWDEVKKLLTDSGVWEMIASTVSAAMETARAAFSAFKLLALNVWNDLKNYVIPIARFIFDTVAAVFRMQFGVITGILKVATGILTLNWATFSEGLQNITVSLFNGVTALFTSGFKLILGLSSGLLKSVGMDGAAKSLDTYAASLEAIKIPLRGIAAEAKKAAAAIELPGVTVKGKRTPGQFAGGGSGTASGGKEASLQQTGDVAIMKRYIADLETKIQNLGNKAPQALIEKLAQAREALKSLLDLTNTKPVNVGKLSGADNGKSFMQAASSIVGGLAVPDLNGLKEFKERAKIYADVITQVYGEMRSTVKNAASSTALEMSNGFGEVLGGIATGQANLFGSLIGAAVDFLSSYLAKIGQANIAAGAALIAAGAISLNPIMVAQGKQKLLAGGLLNVAAGATKVIGGALASSASGGGMKKYAKGGVFDRQSVGIFGEYAGASMNREIATPERLMGSVFRNELENFGARQSSNGSIPSRIEVSVSGRLRGQDIAVSGNRYIETQDNYR